MTPKQEVACGGAFFMSSKASCLRAKFIFLRKVNLLIIKGALPCQGLKARGEAVVIGFKF